MDNVYLIVNDAIDLIRYKQTINFSNLDSICLKLLVSEFSKVNDTVEFGDETIKALGRVLKTIKQDAIFYHKKDFEITVEFLLTHEQNIELYIHADREILPFRGLGNDGSLFIEMQLSELNKLNDYILEEIDILSCKINTGFLEVIKKVDTFLEYDNSLYSLIIEKGLSPKSVTFELPSFNVDVDENGIVFKSLLKGTGGRYGSPYDLPFFKIHIYDGRVLIRISGTEITLTKNEFLTTPHQDIIDVILGILKIKNLPVTSMSNLKDYILIQDMSKI